jgi:hypothetical protein
VTSSGQAAQIEATEVFDLDRLQRIDIRATERCAPRWDRSTGALLLLAEAVVSGESGRTLGQDDHQSWRNARLLSGQTLGVAA